MAKLKIAFFGTPRLAQIVLESLINSEYKPALVITAPDAKAGRGQKISSPPAKQTAAAVKIPVIQPLELSKMRDKLAGTDLAILVAYGKIIPKEILETPRLGFINLHPSLLPKYRGPSPIQTAILNGEKTTGVTIIKLDEELDHGPVIASKEIEMEKTDTHLSLIEKLGVIGSNLLLEILPEYLIGKSDLKEQNHKEATYTRKITKEDGHINLENIPDRKTLERMTCAYYPWPNVWTEIEGKIIKFLPWNMIQPEGKKPMTIKEFLNGYPRLKEKFQKLV